MVVEIRRMMTSMLANRRPSVKGTGAGIPVQAGTQGGRMRLGRLLRALLRLVVGAGAAAGTAWLTRALLARAAGEPAVSPAGGQGPSTNGSRRTPLSFDSWPSVPQAPPRPEAGEH